MQRYYRAPEKKGRRALRVATALVVVLIAADLLSGGAIRGHVRAMSASASHWSASVLGVLGIGNVFASRASLQASNQALASQVALLSERAAAATVLRHENDTLRQLVHLAQTTQGVTAPVLSSASASPYGTFIIGAGDNSVQKGDLVLTAGGFVVGTVGDVRAGSALVDEVFSPGNKIDALINGAQVQVVGQGGGNARTEVPRDVSVASGDGVVVPQYGQRLVGVVGAVASTSVSATQEVYIRIPSALSSLQFVYVAKVPH